MDERYMKKIIITLGIAFAVTGCQKLPDPVCHGKAIVGGVVTTVPIYAVKKEGNYTKYKAGSVFNWRWVGRGAFTTMDCPKP
jgi:hypothetical protein